MRALILHAHPDDELIFAGQLMLSRPHWDWTTVSLTGGLRAKTYRGINLGHPDPWRVLSVGEFREWKRSVEALNLAPDIVFTHNRMGEYGHPHHMAVHRIAHELFPLVWDFYCRSETSVGEQDLGPVLTVLKPTPAKRELFEATYGPAVYAELAADRPSLMWTEFEGGEMFNGPGTVPE